MKKTKFTEAQIVFAIKQSETGTAVKEVCRKMGISEAAFYSWKRNLADWVLLNSDVFASWRKKTCS